MSGSDELQARPTLPLPDLTLQQLLSLQGQILAELRARELVRTRNLIGEVAEAIGARAYGATLAAPAQAGWDVLAKGQRLQVKARVVDQHGKRAEQFTPFNDVEAELVDAFVFVVFDSRSFDILWARQIAYRGVMAMAQSVPRSTRRRVNTRHVLSCSDALDVTEQIRVAYRDLNPSRSTAGSADVPI